MKKLAEVVNKSVSMEKNSIEKMCSCGSDVAKDLSSSGATDTCGDGSIDVKERHIRPSKVPYFRTFWASGHQCRGDGLTAKIALSEHINRSGRRVE